MKIFSVLEKTQDEVFSANKLKRTICLLLGIEIQKKYYFQIVLKMAGPDTNFSYIEPNRIMKLEGCDANWLTLAVERNIVTIRNVKPTVDFCIGNEIQFTK